jgi:hypothetical protein
MYTTLDIATDIVILLCGVGAISLPCSTATSCSCSGPIFPTGNSIRAPDDLSSDVDLGDSSPATGASPSISVSSAMLKVKDYSQCAAGRTRTSNQVIIGTSRHH